MDFCNYQQRALLTAQKPKIAAPPEVVPLLGLAGEAGELLSEYKKISSRWFVTSPVSGTCQRRVRRFAMVHS
jgi:hypothetical protein